MENVKVKLEELKKAMELVGFASIRAKQLLMARGCNYKTYYNGVEFEENQITIKFEENTRHDCPDRDSVTLTVEQLELSDEEWMKYVEGINNDRLEKIKLSKEATEKRELEEKEKQFEKLKKELGK